jgi:hypothetical protein
MPTTTRVTGAGGTFTLITSREKIDAANKAAFVGALEDTARHVARHAPRDKGTLAASIYSQVYAGPGLRGKVASSDNPGKVRMRQFGGTIVARNGGYLVFRTRDGRWHSVRQVTQRPGGPSNGYRPLFEPAEDFFDYFAARLRRITSA